MKIMKITTVVALSMFFLCSNIIYAEATVNGNREYDESILLENGVSVPDISKLGFRSEILADYIRVNKPDAALLQKIKDGMTRPTESKPYEPNSGHPKGTPPSPKDPERIPLTIKLNGEQMTFDVEQSPIKKNGTTLIPLRKVFEALGANVSWDAETYSVKAQKNNTTMVLTIGEETARINDIEVNLEQAPEIINDNTMVPLRFVSESFGAKVDWIEYTRTVLIYNKLVPQTLAYLSPGQAQAVVRKNLGEQYKEVASKLSKTDIWKYEEETKATEQEEPLIDFDGIINGTVESQLLINWAMSESSTLVVNDFLLYFMDAIDGKVHEYHVLSDLTIEDRILY